MAEKSTAELLQNRLTENGLIRVLSQQDVSPDIVKKLSPDEAARLIERDFAPAPKTSSGPGRSKKKKAKKSAKKAKTVKKAKKAKKSSLPPKLEPVSKPRYWQRVKRELHLLLCTNDQKYASVRRELNAEGKVTQTLIASSITGAVAPVVGASAIVIGPLVTLGLFTLVRVGTNAWCAGQI